MAIKQHILASFLLLVSSYAIGQDLETLKNNKPFDINGTVSLRTVFYNLEGRESHRDPFNWYFSGNPVISIYGIPCPISFNFNNRDNNIQPPSTIGASPYYKWLTLHLGYRNINFSRYTLAGHLILGGGLEVKHPSGIRGGLMHGRLNKASGMHINPIDSTIDFRRRPMYKRIGTAFKLGYGTDSNYVDVIYFRSKDFVGSIDSSVNRYFNILPGENTIISLTSGQHFLDKFFFEIELAQSVLTENSVESSDTIDHGFWENSLGKSISINSSTRSGRAMESILSYDNEKYGAKLRYKSIGKDFESFGMYYVQKDIRNITFEPWLKAWDRKLDIKASLGHQAYNKSDNNKLKSNRLITSVKTSYRPFKTYRINGHFTNYSVEQERKKIVYDTNYSSAIDSLYSVSHTTSGWGIMQMLNIQGQNIMQNIVVNYTHRKLQYDDDELGNTSNFTSNMLFVNYMFNYLPFNINTTISYNYSNFVLSSGNSVTKGPGIIITKALLKRTLRLSINYNINTRLLDEKEQQKINKVSFRATYRLKKNHRFIADVKLKKVTNARNNELSYNENIFDIRYLYRF